MRSSQALAVALAILASTVVAAQPADQVELTVRLDAVVSGDEAPAGDVTIQNGLTTVSDSIS
ncbi:MAG: hypothetical protein OYL92_07365 [Acidobacteriota bacterium]|nr:hypothetical protein [Acidobacteriota bacterium]MDE2923813.1 hypothetical protein [Acidobacteriota bacterium]MDE3264775.1 hypothetical protein [Acidobacteriota bacterium]